MTAAADTSTHDPMPGVASSLLPPATRVSTRVGALAVHDTGAAEPQGHTIVLWSSILADHRIYRHPIEAWRDRHRLIAIEGPGHGQSGPAPGHFSMQDCGQAVGEVLDALGVAKPVVIVGTSWGGLVAGEFALAQAGRTQALVMLNAPVCKAAGGPSLGDRFVVLGARWIHASPMYRNGVAKAFFLPATLQRGGLTLEDFHQHLRAVDGRALAQAVRSVLIEREPLAPRLHAIQAPTLFVAGRHDAMYPVEVLRQAAQTLPHGHFEVVDTAHISVVDAPATVTALMDRFLQLQDPHRLERSA